MATMSYMGDSTFTNLCGKAVFEEEIPQNLPGEAMSFTPDSLSHLESNSALSEAARETLILDHLAMVRHIARKLQSTLPAHVELDELVAAGTLGLVDAAAKFDPRAAVQFGSYAQFRVRGAILDSLRDLDWGPRELRRKGRSVEQAIAAATRRIGRSPSEAEVASEMRLALSDYQALLGELSGLEIGSLNLVRGEESGEEEIAYVAGAPEEQPLFQCLRSEMKQHLVEAIDALPERERMVMTLYYYEELTLKEIGEVLSVGESRVSQLRASATVRLRAAMSGLAAAR